MRSLVLAVIRISISYGISDIASAGVIISIRSSALSKSSDIGCGLGMSTGMGLTRVFL